MRLSRHITLALIFLSFSFSSSPSYTHRRFCGTSHVEVMPRASNQGPKNSLVRELPKKTTHGYTNYLSTCTCRLRKARAPLPLAKLA
jgi:hypothetical protein